MLTVEGLAGWTVKPVFIRGETESGAHELYKVFEFADFRQAFSFMNLVAREADKRNHHPEWRNVWNTVWVHQRSWDAKHVVTDRDFELARSMNDAASKVAGAKKPPLAGELR